MENFNLKKFLVENRLTANSKLLQEEIVYKTLTLGSPLFKKLVAKVQQISDESGNDWDALKAYLQGTYPMFKTQVRGTNPVAYVVNFFTITKGKDEYVEKRPQDYVQVGEWYITPW